MTKSEELNALADRCEREEASASLNAAIAQSVGVGHRSRRTVGGANKGREWRVDSHGGVDEWSHHPPPYTTSLDAAVTLVPEAFKRSWSAGDNSDEAQIFARLGYEHEATGLSPALALCAAALRARASLTEE